MSEAALSDTMEDHALEAVPMADRKNWLSITWSTTGLVTTLIMLFFGALMCFVAGVEIALYAGLSTFVIASSMGWAIAKVAVSTGYSNTLITRKYGMGINGSALASIIFALVMIGFLALENALLYRGILFFFSLEDSGLNKLMIYSGLSLCWIFLTLFGYELVARFSSWMLVLFLVVITWVLVDIVGQSGYTTTEVLSFKSQFPAEALTGMGIFNDWDKYLFALNISLAPSLTLVLCSADFGRYGKSTAHTGVATSIGLFFQTVLVMTAGGVLMYSGATAMVEHYITVDGMTSADAQRHVLSNPDSIAATFMVYGGIVGFLLMMIAQTKAQVLNTYSSSLSVTNLFDSLFNWKPGRVFFVVLVNVIAVAMTYGHILEWIESWLQLLGAFVGSLSGLIVLDYFVISRIYKSSSEQDESVNWAGVITVVSAIVLSHFVLKPYIGVEVLAAFLCVAVLYPFLRLVVTPQVKGQSSNPAAQQLS